MSQLKNKNLPSRIFKIRLNKNDVIVVLSGKYKGKDWQNHCSSSKT